MVKKLSEILDNSTEFNFFKALSNLEYFDLARLDAVIDNVLIYLSKVKDSFKEIEALGDDYKHDLEWLCEGKTKFYEIYRNIDSIDSIVSQSLNLLEANIDKDPDVIDGGIFDKLDNLGEITLEMKKTDLILFKSYIDLSIEFNDIAVITMDLINNELENCLKICFKIHEKRFSSPVRHAPTFNLDMLTKKLLQQKANLRLPVLNDLDRELYEEFLDLKNVVDPLRASLVFIPPRLEDFRKRHKNLLFVDFDKMNEKYENLLKLLQFLESEVADLKYELVDKRWNEIFSYLNTEMSFLISSIDKDIPKLSEDGNSSFKQQILKRLKYTMNIVETTFIIINQAIDEDLVGFKVVERTNELAELWLLSKNSIPNDFLKRLEDDGGDLDELKDFNKLSLDSNDRVNFEFGEPKTLKLANSVTPVRNKRKSKAGQFLIGKLNLRPILIENDPSSVKKSSDLPVSKKILGESAKLNKLESSPIKIKSDAAAQNFPSIPKLKSSLKRLSNESNELEITDIIRDQSISQTVISPIKETIDTSRDHLGEEKEDFTIPALPDIFKTPSSSRIGSDPISKVQPVLNHSSAKIFISKIPRPVPRSAKCGRDSERPSRASSSLSSTRIERPYSSLEFSRETRSEVQPSRIGLLNSRVSMIPQTPVRSCSVLATNRRKSMLPQPTPIKELVSRSEASAGSRSRSRLSSGWMSNASLERNVRQLSPPRIRPSWK